MTRGNLIVYDLEGNIWFQSGQANGDLLPHVYPVGLPFLEIPFNAEYYSKRVLRIDLSGDMPTPIFSE